MTALKTPRTYTPKEARQYARLVRRPLDVLIRVADTLRLIDAELGALARTFHAAVAVRAAAPVVEHPFLDLAMTDALAAVVKSAG